jgi:hypothetical protein
MRLNALADCSRHSLAFLRNLSASSLAMNLWVHCDIAGPTTEVRTMLGLNSLKAFCDGKDRWHVVVDLGEAYYPSSAALRTSQFFVPVIDRRHGHIVNAACLVVGSVPDRNCEKTHKGCQSGETERGQSVLRKDRKSRTLLNASGPEPNAGPPPSMSVSVICRHRG